MCSVHNGDLHTLCLSFSFNSISYLTVFPPRFRFTKGVTYVLPEHLKRKNITCWSICTAACGVHKHFLSFLCYSWCLRITSLAFDLAGKKTTKVDTYTNKSCPLPEKSPALFWNKINTLASVRAANCRQFIREQGTKILMIGLEPCNETSTYESNCVKAFGGPAGCTNNSTAATWRNTNQRM